MIIELNEKPLSINEAFQGRRFKTPAYKAYERKMLILLPKAKKPFPDMMSIDFIFGFSSPLSDLDNPVKLLLDIMQKKYGFNDRNVWELGIRKFISKEPYIGISIKPYLPFDEREQRK